MLEIPDELVGDTFMDVEDVVFRSSEGSQHDDVGVEWMPGCDCERAVKAWPLSTEKETE